MISKKDFIAAAGLLKMSLDNGVLSFDQAEVIGKFLAVYFHGQNPRFKAGTFFAACGLGAINK